MKKKKCSVQSKVLASDQIIKEKSKGERSRNPATGNDTNEKSFSSQCEEKRKSKKIPGNTNIAVSLYLHEGYHICDIRQTALWRRP